MRSSFLGTALLSAAATLAQNNASTTNGCDDGYFPGTDTVILILPYTYAQVMSIIGSFRNITWSGSPYDSVTINGTDNTVGTARTYDIDGAHIVETIEIYSKPPNGPYDEVHYLDPFVLPLPGFNLSAYSDYDGTTVVQTCGGLASTMNFTINVCANNATIAAATLHAVHLGDAQTVGVFLGGQNFTSCAALEGSGNASASPTPAPYTGGATARLTRNSGSSVMATAVLLAFALTAM